MAVPSMVLPPVADLPEGKRAFVLLAEILGPDALSVIGPTQWSENLPHEEADAFGILDLKILEAVGVGAATECVRDA